MRRLKRFFAFRSFGSLQGDGGDPIGEEADQDQNYQWDEEETFGKGLFGGVLISCGLRRGWRISRGLPGLVRTAWRLILQGLSPSESQDSFSGSSGPAAHPGGAFVASLFIRRNGERIFSFPSYPGVNSTGRQPRPSTQTSAQAWAWRSFKEKGMKSVGKGQALL